MNTQHGSSWMRLPKGTLLRAITTAAALFAGNTFVAATCGGCATSQGSAGSSSVQATIADVRAIHHDVVVVRSNDAKEQIAGLARVGDGEQVTTSEHGRARVQTDSGTLFVLDGNAAIRLSTTGTQLERGRLFVDAPRAAQTKVELGRVSTIVSGARASFTHTEQTSVYCAEGELVLVSGNTQTRVASGETAHVVGSDVKVIAEKAFDDWTGGLAVPWSSEVGSRSAIPELRALSSDTDPGSPLVTRSHEVSVEIQGELAFTRSRTTYFNGGSASQRLRAQLALPNDAILTRVNKLGTHEIAAQVAIGDGPSISAREQALGLEWAGDGYLSGELGAIGAGEVLVLELDYVEWLPRGNDASSQARVYRYPLQSNPSLPPVGMLSIRLEAKDSAVRWSSANAGATLGDSTQVLQFRQADVNPTGDFVAEVTHPTSARARAYVQGDLPSNPSDPERPLADAPYVVLRADLPEQANAGLTLALVLDTSMSVGGAAFETARAVVDALLFGLSPNDEIVVFTADQSARALGKSEPQPLTPGLRDELRAALAGVRPGGASHLELALGRAADALDSPSRGDKAGSGVVVYVGDGRPTLGESDATRLRQALLRRPTGSPRLSAIAIGANADRWALARLTNGTGAVYDVLDRADAAQVGSQLLASALAPTWRDVDLELGTAFDRVYPRNPRTVIQGSTVTVVGRLRGPLPANVGLRFRKGAQATTDTVPLERVESPAFADISQRWAQARIRDIATSEGSIEPAIALAAEAKLLTPWTGWYFVPPAGGAGSRRFEERVLALSSEHDAAYGLFVDPIAAPGTLLLDRADSPRRISLVDAAQLAVKRVLSRASRQLRACRQARSAAARELGQHFMISLSVDAGGVATRVVVRTVDSTRADAQVERCMESVVRGLPRVAAGVAINLTHPLVVPDQESAHPTRCSDVSRISLPLRLSVWRTRSVSVSGYQQALRGCETPRWRDKRAYLDLLLDAEFNAERRLRTAGALRELGYTDAAEYVRHEALRRLSSFEELQTVPQELLDEEPPLPVDFDKAYDRAKTPEAQLEVVQRFLSLSPHNPVLRRRLLFLLEALGQKSELLALIRSLRGDAVIEASLLATSASVLRRLDLPEEGARVFGELLERAPGDPWTLAYVGDRLRAEGLFDEAVVVYEQLARAVPAEAAVHLRLAMAHAGAGRLDVATRLLQTVAATGGRSDNGSLGDLGAIVQAALLAGAANQPTAPNGDSNTRAELVRRLKQTPLPDAGNVVLVTAPPSDNPVTLRLAYDSDDKARQAPNFDASQLGLNAVLVERGTTRATLYLRRADTTEPARDVPVQVYVLTSQSGQAPGIQTRELTLHGHAEAELTITGGQLQ